MAVAWRNNVLVCDIAVEHKEGRDSDQHILDRSLEIKHIYKKKLR
jgi:hypothetical protein